jgi:hypothetical protein
MDDDGGLDFRIVAIGVAVLILACLQLFVLGALDFLSVVVRL